VTTTSSKTRTVAYVPFRWVRIAIAILFGLLFAFYFYEAISQTLQLSAYISSQNPLLHKVGHDELQFPWIAIAPLLLLPVVTYVLGFLIGRRRPLIFTVAIFVMALAVLSAGSLTLESVASQLTRIT
jgi:hypothetical protein